MFMNSKELKKQVKLYLKWIALVGFIAFIFYLQYKFGSAARLSFCIFAGGIGMFVFGMDLMSNTVQVIAGNGLKNIISNLTRNTFTAMLTGLFVSGLIQSSTAATVMVVGFVNAGLMNLEQAIGVILGANVGTTVTAQLIAFNLTDLAWPALAIGSSIIFFAKAKKNKAVGEAIVGFALLFLGIKFMNESMMQYTEHEVFKQLFTTFAHNRLLGVLAGLIVTLFVHSSAATVGLTMSLASTNAFGSDPHTALMASVPIILGNNIGTCVTAILSSMGATRNAKRAAFAHLVFNTSSTLLVLPFLESFCSLIEYTSQSSMRQIANAHSIFNVTAVLVFLPLVGFLKKVVLFIIPMHEDEVTAAKSLDKRLLQTPPIAIRQAEINLDVMVGMISKNFSCIDGLLAKNEITVDDVVELAAKVDDNEKDRSSVAKDLSQFLIYLTQKELSEEMRREVTRYIYVSKDIEIIASQQSKLVHLLEDQTEGGAAIGSESREELAICMTSIGEIYKELTQSIRLVPERFEELMFMINSQAQINIEARENLMQRIKENKHSPYESIILLDALRSVDSLLGSMRYLCDHVRYKF